MLSCWLTWHVWLKLFVSFMLTSLGFLVKKTTTTKFLVLSLYPPCYQSHIKIPCYVSRLHDWAWSNFVTHCSVYALDLRFYVQINLMLLKHCLTMLSKKRRERDEKKACQRSMTQKEREREREREKMACQRSMAQWINSDIKGACDYLCTNLISS